MIHATTAVRHTATLPATIAAGVGVAGVSAAAGASVARKARGAAGAWRLALCWARRL